MNIVVDGWRATAEDWKDLQGVPKNQLPTLTTEQKAVAKKLGIAEEDYARSAEAGRRTQEKLLMKTDRFARMIQEKVKERASQAVVENIVLRTLEHKFEIEILLDGARVPIRIDEDLVDDLMEGGTKVAEERISRILDFAFPSGVRK